MLILIAKQFHRSYSLRISDQVFSYQTSVLLSMRNQAHQVFTICNVVTKIVLNGSPFNNLQTPKVHILGSSHYIFYVCYKYTDVNWFIAALKIGDDNIHKLYFFNTLLLTPKEKTQKINRITKKCLTFNPRHRQYNLYKKDSVQ